MALNEGVLMSEDEINDFVHPFKPDIRQSILQLQYVLSTGVVQQVIYEYFLKIFLFIFTELFYLENTLQQL